MSDSHSDVSGDRGGLALRFDTNDVFEAEEQIDELLLSESVRPEFHGLPYRYRLNRLLKEAGARFRDRGCFHLEACAPWRLMSSGRPTATSSSGNVSSTWGANY
jgi:hypothetical protein